MTKTDAEIAHDVYMRLKGETASQRSMRKFSEAMSVSIKTGFGAVRMGFNFGEDFGVISVQTHDYKAQPQDDRVDALIYAPRLVGKRAYGIILDDVTTT